MFEKIITKKRSFDWKAFLKGHEEIWECADTEEEAIGKLVKRLQDPVLLSDQKVIEEEA